MKVSGLGLCSAFHRPRALLLMTLALEALIPLPEVLRAGGLSVGRLGFGVLVSYTARRVAARPSVWIPPEVWRVRSRLQLANS